MDGCRLTLDKIHFKHDKHKVIYFVDGHIFVLSLRRLDNRNLKFFKKYSITHFKALNERISEWAYFLDLNERF